MNFLNIFNGKFLGYTNGHSYVPQGFGNMPDHRRHAVTTQQQQQQHQYFSDYTNSIASSTPVTTDTLSPQAHEYDHMNGGTKFWFLLLFSK